MQQDRIVIVILHSKFSGIDAKIAYSIIDNEYIFSYTVTIPGKRYNTKEILL